MRIKGVNDIDLQFGINIHVDIIIIEKKLLEENICRM